MNDEDRGEIEGAFTILNAFFNDQRGIGVEEAEVQRDAGDMAGWLITAILKVAYSRGWDATALLTEAVDNYSDWVRRLRIQRDRDEAANR